MKISILTLSNILGISLLSLQALSQQVIVNGEPLSKDIIHGLEQYYRVKVQPGRYWYDPVCGSWGIEGEGMKGVILPNLKIGGPLSPDASKGTSGVFFNGRQLTITEQRDLSRLVGQPVLPGKYWVDAFGNAGYAGQPAIVNLYSLANQQNSNSLYRGTYTDTGSGSQGGTFYVIGKDFSYISGN